MILDTQSPILVFNEIQVELDMQQSSKYQAWGENVKS
jgi:hypothetical protein